jgi:hypothetical protein
VSTLHRFSEFCLYVALFSPILNLLNSGHLHHSWLSALASWFWETFRM